MVAYRFIQVIYFNFNHWFNREKWSIIGLFNYWSIIGYSIDNWTNSGKLFYSIGLLVAYRFIQVDYFNFDHWFSWTNGPSLV